jgi:hypothetical protein
MQIAAVTQGISPFDERAGVDEWQTSRFPRNELPSFTVMGVNEPIGESTVKAITTKSMNVTGLMVEV